MINFDTAFFQDLRALAQQNLSQAHLKQHFTAAEFYLAQSGRSHPGNGTWSSCKPMDSVTYVRGKLNGKKHWISGIPLCDWAIIAARTESGQATVLFDPKTANVEPAPTLGMEDTLTSHITFTDVPAIFLYDREDPKSFPVNSHVNLSFLTIQLGLMEALFDDIDNHTGTKYDYEKKKLRLDVEIMDVLWKEEVKSINGSYLDQQALWDRRCLLYAFGKKTLTSITNFVTEVTGSGLFEPRMAGHQRYKDALIYSTHMQNFSAAVDFLEERRSQSK